MPYAADCFTLQLNEDGGEEDDEGEDGVVSYREWQLPAADFEGQWDALHYESSIKRRLLQYASTALLFSDLGVNSQLISWNRCDAAAPGCRFGLQELLYELLFWEYGCKVTCSRVLC
jgi:hypothetical protein